MFLFICWFAKDSSEKKPRAFRCGVLVRFGYYFSLRRPSAAPHGGIIITTTLIIRLITWMNLFMSLIFSTFIVCFIKELSF
ncbi:hypothetical protein PROVRUST_06594 [Providencia rustigianii DSM 4541]|uniref:Uncharacterized protein n=1 Tax=Providencia rustigianii DSM 4541 TaxID=500637 RepID=D1P309_9GAMM|nr:hypothetical protein PROVRUST_06594 [Providencia rustigianii DSM 4541]